MANELDVSTAFSSDLINAISVFKDQPEDLTANGYLLAIFESTKAAFLKDRLPAGLTQGDFAKMV